MADTKPGDGNVERLRRWAVSGAGAALFAWGSPGDFDRCRTFYRDKIPEKYIDGWCAKLHKLATGAPPGHAPGEKHDKD